MLSDGVTLCGFVPDGSFITRDTLATARALRDCSSSAPVRSHPCACLLRLTSARKPHVLFVSAVLEQCSQMALLYLLLALSKGWLICVNHVAGRRLIIFEIVRLNLSLDSCFQLLIVLRVL